LKLVKTFESRRLGLRSPEGHPRAQTLQNFKKFKNCSALENF